jgi:hypothetical protein
MLPPPACRIIMAMFATAHSDQAQVFAHVRQKLHHRDLKQELRALNHDEVHTGVV